MQDQLAAQLVQKLALQLSGDEQSRLTARSTSNPKALQHYMQGRFFYNKRTVAGNTRALELFTEAVRLDPRYAQAYLGQVLAWDRLLEGGAANLNETLPKLHAALDQALTLDPAYGEAYGYRSLASRVYDWKFDEADRDSARSMELDPNNPVVLQWRGIHLLAVGRVEEALALHARSVDIDPVDLGVRSLLCAGLLPHEALRRGDPDEPRGARLRCESERGPPVDRSVAGRAGPRRRVDRVLETGRRARSGQR